MFNKKIVYLLGLILLSFGTLSYADNSVSHPDSTKVKLLGNVKNLMECCYRQRKKANYTQGTCSKGSYVVYAVAKSRFGRGPAIYYQCETIKVTCDYLTPAACAAQRAKS